MAVTSLKDAFPRMSLIEKQGRLLRQLAFGMMPQLLETLDVSQKSPVIAPEKV